MKNFEEHIRNSFDDFSPEVRPELWQSVQQNIAQSSAPTDPGTRGLSRISQLGVKGWAAIIATAAVLTVVAVRLSRSPEKSDVQSSVVVTQQTPDTPERTDSPTLENSISPEREVQATTGISDQQTDIHSEKVIQQPGLSTTHALTGTEAEENRGTLPIAGAPASENSPATQNPKTNETVTGALAPVQDQMGTRNDLRLIVSNKKGFAPLRVTVMTTDPKQHARFDFGDGTVKESSSASHTYSEAGTYGLTCNSGNVRLSEQILVYPSIPSAFSPNGDGINDLFETPEIEGMVLEIRIFTRTGKLVFTQKGSRISWDGLQGGRMAEPDTYLYDIFATSAEGGSFKQKGTINLFR